MLKNTLTSLLLFCSVLVFGQCPNQILILGSQNEIDAFPSNYPNCTELTRSLIIGIGSGSQTITNLDGLSQITSIGLVQNASDDRLSINFTENLMSLQGLNGLEFVEGLAISGTGITNFSGLENLTIINGGLDIHENYNLINFEGLSSLEIVDGSFQVGSNALLVNFEGIGDLISTINGPGDIVIGDNPSLLNLQGLEGWQESRNFSIYNNAVLNSIVAIENLEHLNAATVININDNPNMSNCAVNFVCESFSNPNIFRVISNNNSGCNSEQEVENNCLLSLTDEELQESVTLYPNPVNKLLQIEISNNINIERIIVSSILGEKLISVEKRNALDFSNLKTGTYLVKIITSQGEITKMIIKK